jgi:acetyltransferase-like isoleucine patch superfamily enzyme
MKKQLEELGVLCDPDRTHINGTIVCEYPVQLTCDNTFENRCEFGAFSYIGPRGALSNVTFGRFCSVAPDVLLGPPQHPTHTFSSHFFVYNPLRSSCFGEFEPYLRIVGKEPFFDQGPIGNNQPEIKIGNDVWIGTRARVMGCLTIGERADVAAGAVVTKDVEPYTVVGGVPAKVIKKRFSDDLIRQFAELQWWRYDMGEVSNQVDYGRPQEVLDFMRRKIGAGTLPILNHRKVQVQRNGPSLDVTLVG